MKLRCIIVDDEPGAQHILENYLGRVEQVELAGKFFNAIDAFNFIKKTPVDIILLDINLPETDGFGLIHMLEHNPGIIFTTAYSDHALKGFDYNAIDYLLKPIRFERFVVAIEKARKWKSLYPQQNTVHSIQVKVNGNEQTIEAPDIRYVESVGNYLKIFTQSTFSLVLMTMTEIEKKLSEPQFVRIHKSYLVNTSKIVKVLPDEVQLDNTTLPIGKTYKRYVEQFMNQNS
jgi:two-component system, LytTR family, response regulator